jgi:hypothetical protein
MSELWQRKNDVEAGMAEFKAEMMKLKAERAEIEQKWPPFGQKLGLVMKTTKR